VWKLRARRGGDQAADVGIAVEAELGSCWRSTPVPETTRTFQDAIAAEVEAIEHELVRINTQRTGHRSTVLES
jgi:hypothetical protein